jgi:hypothetical protein
MRHRLAALDEQLAWSADLEAEKASFLRRKLEQGRRFGAPKESKQAPLLGANDASAKAKRLVGVRRADGI